MEGTPATVTFWVKTAGAQDGLILSRREGGKSFVIGLEKGALYLEISGQRTPTAGQTMAPGAWTHVAVVCEPGKSTLFVNGTQTAAVMRLSGQGIGVAPGAPFSLLPGDGDHIRVTVGLVREGHEELAEQIAVASRTSGWGARAR